MDRLARRFTAGFLLTLLTPPLASAADLCDLNCRLAGRVLDFTHNHGCDHRIWSQALGISRDCYVYVPPRYDPNRAYPLLLWIHGFGGDEKQFTRQVVRALDEAIVSGAMPPVIAAAPDVSVPSKWKPWYQGSWCLNGRQGQWEDFVTQDVLGFMESHFRLRPEREARAIAGWSMGGFSAYRLGFRHPEKFRLLVGVYPVVDIRYADKDGHWGTDFHPETLGRLENLGWTHCLGLYPRPWRFPVPCGIVYWPAWGNDKRALERMSEENPYDLLERLDIRDGQYDMFVAYGRKDEYNVDAQVDSFLHRARQRGLNIWVRDDPEGHHSTEYVNQCMPDVLVAVGERLRERLPDLTPQAHGDRVARSNGIIHLKNPEK